jgi:hypothetical protein
MTRLDVIRRDLLHIGEVIEDDFLILVRHVKVGWLLEFG